MSNQSYVDVGVLRSTLLPNLQFHAALSLPAYIVARATNRVEIKDYLWASAQVLNAWWTSVGRNVLLRGVPLVTALRALSRADRILLTGVSLWGVRLSYRTISRRLRSHQDDDPRYDELKATPSNWNSKILTQFAIEAVIQALITLPFTAPFRSIPMLGIKNEWAPIVEAVAIGLWSAGFALEVAADTQLAQHQSDGKLGLMRSGVWSIVRHPNYLGDALLHLSFPLFLFSQTLFNPITLLGPIANWFFLRYIGGDKENEQSQEDRYAREDPQKRVELAEYRDEKNAFWPSLKELGNVWTWVVIGSGVGGVFATRYIGEALRRW